MQLSENGPKNLKIKAKFIYLISPNKIYPRFYDDLKAVLKTNKVKYFQLRLKKTPKDKIISISKKIKQICKNSNVKFIVNDSPNITKIVDADGCHLGQNDMKINQARKILNKKIIGITCNNSIKKVKRAIKGRADYIAIGAFNKSKTKKIKYIATIKDLKYFRKITDIPIVAIGGINEYNYKKLLLNKANFLAISSFIWKNKKLKPEKAIRKIK